MAFAGRSICVMLEWRCWPVGRRPRGLNRRLRFGRNARCASFSRSCGQRHRHRRTALGRRLTKKWGQPVVIENKPGGDSIVAINAFVSAKDDHSC